MRHTTTNGAPVTCVMAESAPAGGADAVTLIGSDVAFEHTTDGFVPPDDSFFSGG